ncbi:MAG: beta-galactosidase [Eubacteriales bacterium]|nr:beta-galactosidase [Eubacteriales bacterium]
MKHYSNKVKKIVYGGDYNPEQWPEEIWPEDMRLLKGAGVDIVTLNVFSWAAIQPSEDEYDFSKLDKIMEMVRKNGLYVCLATSTGAHPAWMAKRHPDVLRTDFEGRKHKFGFRHNSCPNSPAYHKYSVRIAKKLAERYKDYDNIVAWHISNEYGGECYCENCEKAFRLWLKEKYGTLEALNRAWNTSFWGHTFYDWDEIVLPNALSEHFEYNRTVFQGITLDYRRFNSDSILNCYRMEYDAVKEITPEIPVTTNLMGFYPQLDYQKWGKYMDVISWDNYPTCDATPAQIAMTHDIMRGVGGGKPFLLMEQTPGVSNWHSFCALKRPGVMRLWSYQAVAHGADSVMFFQMRRSIGACEKYHSAVIDHVGNDKTRVYREVAALGRELEKLGEATLGAVTEAKAAIYFDWDNWWALNCTAGPSADLDYLGEVRNYYQALYELNIPIDFVGAEDELDHYQIVIAPLLYMTKPGYDEKIRRFVASGGTFVTTYFSGIVDEHDLVITGGYPGRLRDILGIWAEEIDALPPDRENAFTYRGQVYPARLLCDLIHPEGAESLGGYHKDFYAQMPAVTVNTFGKGRAYYVATRSNEAFYRAFLGDICKECGVEPLHDSVEGLEITVRENELGRYLFFLNHNENAVRTILKDDMMDILTNERYKSGAELEINSRDVKIMKYIR